MEGYWTLKISAALGAVQQQPAEQVLIVNGWGCISGELSSQQNS